jgi:hypothetical protein
MHLNLQTDITVYILHFDKIYIVLYIATSVAATTAGFTSCLVSFLNFSVLRQNLRYGNPLIAGISLFRTLAPHLRSKTGIYIIPMPINPGAKRGVIALIDVFIRIQTRSTEHTMSCKCHVPQAERQLESLTRC